MKKYFLIFAVLVVFPFVLSAQEKLNLSLEDAIATALKNNFGQQILEISRESAEEDVKQSKRDLFPEFNASMSQDLSNKSHNGNYSISGSVALFNGVQGINAIRRSKIALNKSDSEIAQAQNNLAINVIQAFLSVLMNKELYVYQSKVLEVSEQQLEQGRVKYLSGEILESDYLLLKAQNASDKYSMTSSKINRDNSLLELRTLLSLEPGTEIDVYDPIDFDINTLNIPSLQELIEETLAWLPDIRIAAQNKELAEYDLKIARGKLSPTISLGGSIGTGYSSLNSGNWGNQFVNNNVNQVGLTVSIPIWDKGKTLSNIKKTKYQLAQTELEVKQTKLEVTNSLEKEYQNVVSYYDKYVAAEISNDAYKETYHVFSLQFEAGAITTTDLLQQQNNYLNALNTYLQSKYSFILNRKVLDVYMGKEIKF